MGSAAATTFRVAFVPGVTLTKWQRVWRERMPSVAFDPVPTLQSEQLSVLDEGRADVSFVRLPVDEEGLSVMRLYCEQPVVVVPKDHLVAAFDEVTLADLDGENLLTGDPDQTVDLAAAGAGIVLLPLSLARLHARGDVTFRPVTDAAETEVALVWPRAKTTPLIDEFAGIVRGRTARSSRSASPRSASPRIKGR